MSAPIRKLIGVALCAIATPLPAMAAPPLGVYGKLPEVEEVAISPSGNRIAMINTSGEKRILTIIENDAVTKRFEIGDSKIRDLDWATDTTLLVSYSFTEQLYGFTQDKAEITQTLVVPLDGKKPQRIFDPQNDIAKAVFGWYGIREIDGRPYGFFAGVPMTKEPTGYEFRGGPPALYRIDLTDMTARMVTPRGSNEERRSWRVDAAGNVAATLIRDENDGQWKIRNAVGKEIASGENRMGGVGLIALGRSGSTVIYAQQDESSGEYRYFEVPLSGGETKPLFAGIDVSHAYTDRKTGYLIGYLEDGATRKPHFLDPAIDKRVAKIERAFPKLNPSIADWSSDFSKVILGTNGNADSGTWWRVNLVTPGALTLGSERLAIEPTDVGAISTVDYKAADGLDLDGILTLPVGREAKNLPVILLPHGGPTSRDTASFDWWAQAFASRGYAVFQPNFRGSTNRDASFVRAGHGEWGKKMQTDISDGLAHLAKQGIVDPKRACIVGASYGGYAALAGVTLQQGIYKCAVAVAGVSDLSLMVSTDRAESGNDPTIKRVLEAEIGKGRELKEVSPRRFAAKADAPVLLIHGKDDTVVPYLQSKIMADALKDAKKPVELITLASEDHWLSRGDTRLKMLQAAVAFVEKHNPVN